MSSEDDKFVIGGIAFTTKDDPEDAQIDWMVRRLGYTRHLFIGYHYENALLWGRSRGAAGDGKIRVSAKCSDRIGAAGIAITLMENEELRLEVFNILNQHADHMATKAMADGQRNKDRD